MGGWAIGCESQGKNVRNDKEIAFIFNHSML